jgi:hypothetical protein
MGGREGRLGDRERISRMGWSEGREDGRVGRVCRQGGKVGR